MTTMEIHQTERAFQKQDAIFVGRKRVLGRKTKQGELRYVKSVGLGFKTPKEAIEGTSNAEAAQQPWVQRDADH